ncbi:MAG: monovalent cation/H+ antiporter subunit A, partial [Alphaproteobacteria bacterium]|nr:monovalent cation/H+ antiporter subunit A [Alphaproteobacteria bacterium]
MWAAPAFLCVFVIAIGVAPFLATPVVKMAAEAVTGEDLSFYLKIWHGVNTALLMSVAAIIGGVILLVAHRPLERLWAAMPRPEAKTIFDSLITATQHGMRWLTGILHQGAISRYLAI